MSGPHDPRQGPARAHAIEKIGAGLRFQQGRRTGQSPRACPMAAKSRAGIGAAKFSSRRMLDRIHPAARALREPRGLETSFMAGSGATTSGLMI